MSSSRNILITGTSRGLGKKLSEHFLQRGDIVYGCARSEGSIEHVNYHHYQLDISSPEAVKEFFFILRKDIKLLDYP